MQKNTYTLLHESLGIDPKVLDAIDKAEKQVAPIFEELDDMSGAKVGDKVVVEAPVGNIEFKVKKID